MRYGSFMSPRYIDERTHDFRLEETNARMRKCWDISIFYTSSQVGLISFGLHSSSDRKHLWAHLDLLENGWQLASLCRSPHTLQQNLGQPVNILGSPEAWNIVVASMIDTRKIQSVQVVINSEATVPTQACTDSRWHAQPGAS